METTSQKDRGSDAAASDSCLRECPGVLSLHTQGRASPSAGTLSAALHKASTAASVWQGRAPLESTLLRLAPSAEVRPRVVRDGRHLQPVEALPPSPSLTQERSVHARAGSMTWGRRGLVALVDVGPDPH